MGGPYGPPNITAGRWSGFIALLPYFEQNALYDRFTGEGVLITAVHGARVMTAAEGGANCPEAQQLDALICPSNGVSGKPDDHTGFTCYRFCYGDNPGSWSTDSVLRGSFGYCSYRPLSGIKDGTSNTLGFSEKAVDDYNANSTDVKSQAATYASAATGGFSGGYLRDRTICLGSAVGGEYQYGVGGMTNGFTYKWGWHWCGYHWYHVGFATTLRPNAPSCYNRESPYNALMSATSFHTGGVNASLMDGSVTFVSETVDNGTAVTFPDETNPNGKSPFGVWGAYGTRSGGESVSGL